MEKTFWAGKLSPNGTEMQRPPIYKGFNQKRDLPAVDPFLSPIHKCASYPRGGNGLSPVACVAGGGFGTLQLESASNLDGAHECGYGK